MREKDRMNYFDKNERDIGAVQAKTEYSSKFEYIESFGSLIVSSSLTKSKYVLPAWLEYLVTRKKTTKKISRMDHDKEKHHKKRKWIFWTDTISKWFKYR